MKVCALGLLKKGSDGFPYFVDNAKDLCMDCGHCFAICNGALLAKKTQENIVPFNNINIAEEEFSTLVKNRRSIRHYKDKTVPDETIEKVISLTAWSPTACNQQSLEWIAVKGHEKTKALAKLVVEWFRACGQAPAIVEQWDNGIECIFRGAPNIIICHAPTESVLPEFDATIATSTIELALPVFGLGSCWAGLFMLASVNRKISRDIYEFLNIPEGNRIYTGLMVGFPKYKFKNTPNRKTRKIKLI